MPQGWTRDGRDGAATLKSGGGVWRAVKRAKQLNPKAGVPSGANRTFVGGETRHEDVLSDGGGADGPGDDDDGDDGGDAQGRSAARFETDALVGTVRAYRNLVPWSEELETALLNANNAELIDLPIVQLAVDFRWLAVGRIFFWFQLGVYLVFLSCLTGRVLLHYGYLPDGDKDELEACDGPTRAAARPLACSTDFYLAVAFLFDALLLPGGVAV